MNDHDLEIVARILRGDAIPPGNYMDIVSTLDATMELIRTFKHGVLNGDATRKAREIMKRELGKRYGMPPPQDDYDSNCNVENMLAYLAEHPRMYGDLIKVHPKLLEYFPGRELWLGFSWDHECGTSHAVSVEIGFVDEPFEKVNAITKKFDDEYFFNDLRESDILVTPQFLTAKSGDTETEN